VGSINGGAHDLAKYRDDSKGRDQQNKCATGDDDAADSPAPGNVDQTYRTRVRASQSDRALTASSPRGRAITSA